MSLKELVKSNPVLLSLARRTMRTIRPKGIYFLFDNTKPISRYLGQDRGEAVDRHYMQQFLKKYADDIKGVCLEVQDDNYIKEYGQEKVIKADILDIVTTNKKANIHGDLRHIPQIADNTYDCIILTQVFQYIDRLDDAVKEVYRILKPGGILLATLPGISQQIEVDPGPDYDYWRFTKPAAEYLFGSVFSKTHLSVETVGNVYIAQSLLLGLSGSEIVKKNYEYNDPYYPCLVTVRAVKKS